MKGDIVVVDDVSADLRQLREALEVEGYGVRPFPSGRLALRGVSVTPPDLILIDVDMPKMDGYEVCRRLKGGKSSNACGLAISSGFAFRREGQTKTVGSATCWKRSRR